MNLSGSLGYVRYLLWSKLGAQLLFGHANLSRNMRQEFLELLFGAHRDLNLKFTVA